MKTQQVGESVVAQSPVAHDLIGTYLDMVDRCMASSQCGVTRNTFIENEQTNGQEEGSIDLAMKLTAER